ncbi:MAG: T9SS type A sorting domain-containing protein [Bacteroidales bacterium]|nr:T9SS type A sorting domain-containing protein [Bacteroidales bacterium]
MKDYNKLLFSVLIGLILALNLQSQNPPAPLTRSTFPYPPDSVEIKTYKVPTVVEITKDNYQVADTLSLDRALYKALLAMEDEDMLSVPYSTGYNEWTLTTFIYNPLPGSKTAYKTYKPVNKYVPGATTFPKSNIYYNGIADGNITYNFLMLDSTGFYDLGSRAMTSPTPTTLVHSVLKPLLRFPLDYNNPENVKNFSCITSGAGASVNTVYNVTVKAFGKLDIVKGSISNPIVESFDDCFLVETSSKDTMLASGLEFYTESKFYTWYSTVAIEPILVLSYAKLRNNVDPEYWSMSPDALTWHDEFEIAYLTKYNLKDIKTNSSDINNSLTIYPNPSNGKFTVLINNTEAKSHLVNITDILGKKVYTSNFKNNLIDLNLENQSKGVYFLNINSGNNVYTQKLVIK